MLLNMYSVFDDAAGEFLQPFYAKNHAEAERLFADACNNLGHEFGRNPGDYTLYHVGIFDNQNVQITGLSREDRIILANGAEVIRQLELPLYKLMEVKELLSSVISAYEPGSFTGPSKKELETKRKYGDFAGLDYTESEDNINRPDYADVVGPPKEKPK